jgi:biotin operon repressor
MAKSKVVAKVTVNKAAKAAANDDDDDEWVSDPKVRRELDISEMAMWRWDRDETLKVLGWPPKIQVRGRNFRRRRELDAFKARLLADALKRRA